MVFQLDAPTDVTTVLEDLDPTGEAKITFRQARARENQIRDRLVFGEQARTFTAAGLSVQGTLVWTEREELECRLTLVGAENILDENGNDLFHFKDNKLAMSPTAFHKAWAQLPPHVATRFHELCLDANPDWDYRADPNSLGESDDD